MPYGHTHHYHKHAYAENHQVKMRSHSSGVPRAQLWQPVPCSPLRLAHSVHHDKGPVAGAMYAGWEWLGDRLLYLEQEKKVAATKKASAR